LHVKDNSRQNKKIKCCSRTRWTIAPTTKIFDTTEMVKIVSEAVVQKIFRNQQQSHDLVLKAAADLS